MRSLLIIVLAIGLLSCSHSLHPKSGKTDLSTRRADNNKYIVGKTDAVGSRQIFAAPKGKNCLTSSKAVSEYIHDNFKNRQGDSFLILLLDSGNDVIEMEEICDITLTTAENYVPEVIQNARDCKAHSLILVQHQPTRTSVLYQRDREISKDLELALNSINVDFLDHIIISKNQCFSFADNRLL